MRKFFATLIVLALFTCPAFAQQMPDRSAEVAAYVQTQLARFNGTDERRREICYDVIRMLNKIPSDAGNWGGLVKKDRNPNGFPADIAVWKPTLQHVDILTDSGPMWRPHPPITEQSTRWEWFQVDGSPTPGTPIPVPPGGSTDLGPILQRLAVLEQTLAQVNTGLADLQSRLSSEVGDRVNDTRVLSDQIGLILIRLNKLQPVVGCKASLFGIGGGCSITFAPAEP